MGVRRLISRGGKHIICLKTPKNILFSSKKKSKYILFWPAPLVLPCGHPWYKARNLYQLSIVLRNAMRNVFNRNFPIGWKRIALRFQMPKTRRSAVNACVNGKSQRALSKAYDARYCKDIGPPFNFGLRSKPLSNERPLHPLEGCE